MLNVAENSSPPPAENVKCCCTLNKETGVYTAVKIGYHSLVKGAVASLKVDRHEEIEKEGL